MARGPVKHQKRLSAPSHWLLDKLSGTLDLPDFERRRFKEQGLPLHDWTSRPNALTNNSVRANINASLDLVGKI